MRPPHPMSYTWGNLVLTSNYELTCESLSRRVQIPPSLKYEDGQNWEAKLPEAVTSIEGQCVLLDLVCGHFGHAIVDTPARAWFLGTEYFAQIAKPKIIGFPSHGLALDPKKWPKYVNDLLHGIGVSPEEVLFPTTAVKCESLYIPRRVTPYGVGGCGRIYSETMVKAGNAIASRKWASAAFGERIYLSRSKLPQGQRDLLNGAELVIENIFKNHDFEIVHSQDYSLADQIKMIKSASRVAGCVGSQLHLAAFQNSVDFKMFRIAPSHFNQSTDGIIIRESGGKITTFVVDCPHSTGQDPSKSPWSITMDQFIELERRVKDWVNS